MGKVYVADDPQLGRVQYRDRKRVWWLLSVVYPLLPFTGMALHAYTGAQIALGLPLLISYGLMPLLDYFIGEDENNPPEAVVPQLEEDRYYRWLTWLTVPLHFVALIGCAWWVGTQDLSWWAVFMMAYIAGTDSGLGINTGHELGHKRTRLEQWLARLVLAVPAYGHFTVEHGRGHHRWVSTPEDHASSRMGENIYRFALRELPGGIRRAWQLEKERLQKEGRSVWSVHNTLLQSYAITAVLQLGLIAAFGWIMLPFLAVHNVVAWWQLTSANYVEHYGLLRARLPSGAYESPQPHHSWNTNHLVTNLALFHLQRHSDHHAYPSRRYQSLRHFPDLPQLPSGYFGMFPLAYIPPLWFRVMDPRLLALPHVQGDLNKVNIEPSRRGEILARYGTAV
ncbi:MAG: alkane 1-monooxygenase [Hylemonella sp.]|uniref:alkane 1-monooxygenase n=1 Tax=Hylemonella sp. TaxID=2066020 RepID=UPI0022BE0DA9|nr:alkane 1-monooxygenase [Hylemonella sp.]MCZ8253713.1 alkane 1-monooxygenase [Hylemonella sp.]